MEPDQMEKKKRRKNSRNCIWANYIVFPEGKQKHVLCLKEPVRKKKPYRYADVNIKLHQYQERKSGSLQVLRGFKETLLVANKKTNIFLASKAVRWELKIDIYLCSTHTRVCSSILLGTLLWLPSLYRTFLWHPPPLPSSHAYSCVVTLQLIT